MVPLEEIESSLQVYKARMSPGAKRHSCLMRESNSPDAHTKGILAPANQALVELSGVEPAKLACKACL